MPFINVKTNVKLSEDKMEAVKTELGQAISAIPGKSEGWLMVGIEDEYKLWFKGTPDPAAMVEVSIYGRASSAAMNELTGKITGIVSGRTDIPANRIYVKYDLVENWGWSGSNF